MNIYIVVPARVTIKILQTLNNMLKSLYVAILLDFIVFYHFSMFNLKLNKTYSELRGG